MAWREVYAIAVARDKTLVGYSHMSEVNQKALTEAVYREEQSVVRAMLMGRFSGTQF
jgi:hypothetical protein